MQWARDRRAWRICADRRSHNIQQEYSSESLAPQATKLEVETSEWVECMRNAGFDAVSDPGDPEIVISSEDISAEASLGGERSVIEQEAGV